MLEIPICCTVCCSPWELQWWVIGVGISQKAFQSLQEIGEDWNYHSIFLKKKEKGKGWERQHQIKSETHLLQRNMYKGQATAQLTAGDSLVASPQNTFILVRGHKYRDKQKELWKFATIPLQIWAIYVLDEFLNSTALAVELRAKVTGMELTAVRTTRSHTVWLHLSFCSHFCWTVQCW